MSKCPSCNKDENILEVCGRCGYVYPNKPQVTFFDVLGVWIVAGLIVLGLYSIITWILKV